LNISMHMGQHCDRSSLWAWCFLLHDTSCSAVFWSLLYISRDLVCWMGPCLWDMLTPF